MTRENHQTVIGLSSEGFRSGCTCGWSSAYSASRPDVAQAANEHKCLATGKIDPCPACGTKFVSVPLRCAHCGWHLITLEAWKKLAPHGQGYALYMQQKWPTSELVNESNPYAEETANWKKFVAGQAQAARDVQDGEE